MLTCRISSESIYCGTLQCQIWGLLYNKAKYGVLESMLIHWILSWSVYSIAFGWWKTNFTGLWTSAFCDVANWWHMKNVECGCTTTNLLLCNGITIISVLQCLHGKIVHTISCRSKTWWTHKQKIKVFGCPGDHVKSEHHQTWLGDRGPRAFSCTLKTFGVWHNFAASRCWILGGNPSPQFKTPITSIPWANPSKF